MKRSLRVIWAETERRYERVVRESQERYKERQLKRDNPLKREGYIIKGGYFKRDVS